MLFVALPPKWLNKEPQQLECSFEDAQKLNAQGYNIYFYPNSPSTSPKTWVKASDIDTFEYVFVDMDLKDGKYATKEEFYAFAKANIPYTFMVDSGGGVHVYWAIKDLDAQSFLRLSRRLMRLYNTDDAVQQLKQLMRVPGTYNTKDQNNYKQCRIVDQSEQEYTCEELDNLLPPISLEDEEYCQQHYNRTYGIDTPSTVDDTIPPKFGALIHKSAEVKAIWSGKVEDRSKADFRLGHLMFADGFTKDEALSVLVNSVKALERAQPHRIGYAQGILDKIWTYEKNNQENQLSRSVKDILARSGDTISGTRFPCYEYLDATECGFRLSHVVGLIAGSGVGKTSMALNMFMGFVSLNPDYTHFFIPLEQKVEEIADRWRRMCGSNTALYDKVQLMSNYNDDGTFRHLSLDEIKDYILAFEKTHGKKVGCVVIDHIGALKMRNENGENQRIVDICHSMKSFAIQTNTLLVMQSQAPREKAGIGDLEINKDGAYGSVLFESYCDWVITLWQPLKRCYMEGAPLVTAYKFGKIRHKNARKDKIQEDVCYRLLYDPDNEHFRELTQQEETAFNVFVVSATNKRKQDKKTDLVKYQSIKWTDPNESKT